MFARLFFLSTLAVLAASQQTTGLPCIDCSTYTVNINGATAGTSDAGVGFGSVDLSGNQLTFSGLQFSGATNAITSANVRSIGTGNGNGAVVFSLPDFPTGSSGTYSTHTFTLTDSQLALLRCQQLFVCLGSANHPLGDLRGRILGSCTTTSVRTTGVQTTSVQTTGLSTRCNNATDTCRAEEARPGGHAIAVPGIARDFVFANDTGFYSESNQGGDIARLGGQVYSREQPELQFNLDVTFYTYLSDAPSGSPKYELEPPLYAQNGGPINASTFHYYAYWNGTMTGLGQYAGAVIHLDQYMASWQVGVGGNGVNVNYGGSGWFSYVVVSQPTDQSVSLAVTATGDINIDINCTCIDEAVVAQTTGSTGVAAVASTGVTAVRTTGQTVAASTGVGSATTDNGAGVLRPPNTLFAANQVPTASGASHLGWSAAVIVMLALAAVAN